MKAEVLKFTEGYYGLRLRLDNGISVALKIPGSHYTIIGNLNDFPVGRDGDIIEDSEQYKALFQSIADKINR